MKKKVLNIVWGKFPDLRLQKISRLLYELGYEVDILCTENADSKWRYGTIHEIHLPLKFIKRIKNKLHNLFIPSYFYEWWQLDIVEKIICSNKYDIIHYNDLPAAFEVGMLAKKHNLKFFIDMHENYFYNMWSKSRDLGLTHKKYNMNQWIEYEKKAINISDATLVNIKEMGQRMIGMHYVDPDKIHVVFHGEPPDLWEKIEVNSDLKIKYNNNFIILYAGSCSMHRGVDVIIKALGKIKNCIPNIKFIVVGEGHGLKKWISLANEYGVCDFVDFVGWKPFEEMQQYFKLADLFVIPHHKYGQTDNTIPHKIFQCFSVGLPVLVSSCHALQNIIIETNAGLSFEAGSPQSAAINIHSFFTDNTLRSLYSINSKAAGNQIYSWKKMKDALYKAYNSI